MRKVLEKYYQARDEVKIAVVLFEYLVLLLKSDFFLSLESDSTLSLLSRVLVPVRERESVLDKYDSNHLVPGQHSFY